MIIHEEKEAAMPAEQKNESRIGLSVSLHCASQVNMYPQILELEQLRFDWYHIDITDGFYAPNFALGTRLIEELDKIVTKPMYVHLMAVNPEEKLKALYDVGAEGFSFHIETTNFPFRLIDQIKKKNMFAGIIITPNIGIERIKYILPEVDSVTIMSIEPGISGQTFLDFNYQKIQQLREMIDSTNSSAIIEVDGGVDDAIAETCLSLGADSIVGGFYTMFKQGYSITENYNRLMKHIAN